MKWFVPFFLFLLPFFIVSPAHSRPFPTSGLAAKAIHQCLNSLGGKKKIKSISTLRFYHTNARFKESTFTFDFSSQKFRHQVVAPHGRLLFLAHRQKGALIDLSPRGKVLRRQDFKSRQLREVWYFAREFSFPLLQPLSGEIKDVQFVGIRKMTRGKLKGRKVKILSFSLQSGLRYRAYFSANYHFLIMLKSRLPYGKQRGKERVVLYEDYREVDGVLLPHKIYQFTEGAPRKVLKLKIEINKKEHKSIAWKIPEAPSEKEEEKENGK